MKQKKTTHVVDNLSKTKHLMAKAYAPQLEPNYRITDEIYKRRDKLQKDCKKIGHSFVTETDLIKNCKITRCARCDYIVDAHGTVPTPVKANSCIWGDPEVVRRVSLEDKLKEAEIGGFRRAIQEIADCQIDYWQRWKRWVCGTK